MAARRSALEVVFRIRPEERQLALLLFVQCFCVVSSALVVGRTLGTTLFLQRVDPFWLPYTYTLGAAGVSVVAVLYTRVADRFRRDRLVQLTSLGFALACVALRLTLDDSLWFLAMVYVFFDVVGDISLIQLWTLASDVMSPRQSKRLFAFVGAGGTIGGIVLGAVLGSTAELLGTPNLFYVAAALLAVSALAARRIGQLHPPEPAPRSKIERAPVSGLGRVLGDAYARRLAVLLAVATLTSILVDYQFKLAAREAYLGDEEGLAAFFGYFAVATNCAALFLQLFVTSRLLERFGLRAGLAALPGGLLAALGGALAFGGGVIATSIAKGVDAALRFSVNDASLLLLYRPIPPRVRGRAKALLGGVIKPLSAGAGGLAIGALALVLTAPQLAWVTVPLLAAWIALALAMRARYVERLSLELSRRSLLDDESPLSLDAVTRETLLRALVDGDRNRSLNALGLLATFDELPFELPLATLLRSEHDEIVARALELLATHGVLGDLSEIERAMGHEEPGVRARAIAVLLRHGGLEHLLAAGGALTAMLADEAPEVRGAAAETLALVGDPRFHQPLERLLQDADSSVRVAAARAAARVASPALAPHLAPLLASSASRPAARRALAAIGAPALEALADALDHTGSSIGAARVLGDIGGPAAAALLAARLGPSGDARARECAAVLGRLAEAGPIPVDGAQLTVVLDAEIERALATRRLVHELGAVEPTLLGDALEQRWRRSARHALSLASIGAPRHAFGEITEALFSADRDRRGNALELLDNMPLGAMKGRLLELLDERVGGSGDPAPRGARLAALLTDPDPWVVSCAVYELALAGTVHRHAGALLAHPDPLVREAVESMAQGITVRRLSTLSVRMMQDARADEAGRPTMISTVERVLFLKAIDFFADVPSELLVSVARLAEEQSFDPGDELLRQGEQGDCVYLVVEGLVAVLFDGREVAQLGRKECVGEMSLLDAEPRSATVVAKEQTLCLRLDQEPFFDLLAEHPELARGIIAVLSRRLRRMIRDHTRRTLP